VRDCTSRNFFARDVPRILKKPILGKTQQFCVFRKIFMGNIFFNFCLAENVLQTAIFPLLFICKLRRMAICKLDETAANAGFSR
jgi:hypothetical protein